MEKVTIEEITMPTFNNPNGTLRSSGVIGLSNRVDIWFSEIHPLKTVEEATEIAEKICLALNS